MVDTQQSRALISIVIPCFNKEEVLHTTYRRFADLRKRQAGEDFELIFIDDGSSDGTLDILRYLQTVDTAVRVLVFSRRFGHQVAITSGLEHAAGDAVVLVDEDLQNPLEVIGEMLERWKGGVDVAYGIRVERDIPVKPWMSKAFYRLINRVSDVQIPSEGDDFRLLDRRVVDALLSMPERDRFVRGMVTWAGFRQEAVTYSHPARVSGPNQAPFQNARFALHGTLSFSVAPLRLAGWMGFATAGLAMLGIVYAMVLRLFTNISVPGWTLLFIACTFIGGIQLVSLGVLGEYIGRIYGEVKRRPLYIVGDRLGFASTRGNRIRERRAIA